MGLTLPEECGPCSWFERVRAWERETVMVEYRGHFRGTPASVRFARKAVIDYARACGFDSTDLADIALAAGEALANAVEHGNKDLGFIDVRCDFSGDTLAIEIGDAGHGFDFSGISGRPRDPSAVRGFGISIMHAIMDDVRYSHRGAVVRLSKRLRSSVKTNSAEREEA